MVKQNHFQVEVNPHVLMWARESLGLNRTEASLRLKISDDYLRKMEKGDARPTNDLLQKIAIKYHRPLVFLLAQEPPDKEELPKDFRTISSGKTGHFHEKTVMAIRKARGLSLAYNNLLKETGTKFNSFNLSAQLDDDPMQQAQKIRALFNFPEILNIHEQKTAFEFCVDRSFENGILVFQISLTKNNVRGFSLVDEFAPIIVIKKGAEEFTAKLFTLFHEIGHILLHQDGICDLKYKSEKKAIEKWCNAFAAEVLLPLDLLKQNGLLNEIWNENRRNKTAWNDNQLKRIGLQFHLSKYVILRRLVDMDMAPFTFYKAKADEWGKANVFSRGKKKDKVQTSVEERGKPFTLIALKAWKEKKITPTAMSDYFGIPIPHLERLGEFL